MNFIPSQELSPTHSLIQLRMLLYPNPIYFVHMLPFMVQLREKRIVVGSGTISLEETGYVGLAETSDLASNDVNGIQMEILRLMPMGRNADRDAKC